MMRAGAVWACAEIASGAHAEAASYPAEVAGRLGADICTLVEPMVATCWTDDTTLTDEDSPLLGRIAGLARQRAGAARGDRQRLDGARRVLVLRSADDEPWTEREREALAGLGRRLGSVVEQLEARRRDRHLVAELRELDQYRRDLVASLTHDLKTPLTAIALNAELLESDRRLAEAGAHPVAAIRRSAERLASLVDDLLALARAEEGLELAGGPGEVSDGAGGSDAVALVHDACRHAEVEAHQRGLRFVLDVPETLPIGVDGSALARVYVNVVDNAVKFSLPDGEVRISLRTVGGQVEMMCADDGVGISEADQATVFDMFRRARESGDAGRAGQRCRPRHLPADRHPSGRQHRPRLQARRRLHLRGPGPVTLTGPRQRRPTWATRRPAKLFAGMPRVSRSRPVWKARTTSTTATTPTSSRWNGSGSRSRVAPCRWAIQPPRALVTTALTMLASAAPRIVPSSPSWLDSAVAVAAATAPATTVG